MEKGRPVNDSKPQHDILQPEKRHSLFSTITFTRSAGRSQQPSRQENEQGVRAQGPCVQAWVDRRGKGGGRDTDVPTKQGWHNTQERGQQHQHMLSALGQLLTSSLGAQHQHDLDPDRTTSSHHKHTKTHISGLPLASLFNEYTTEKN